MSGISSLYLDKCFVKTSPCGHIHTTLQHEMIGTLVHWASCFVLFLNLSPLKICMVCSKSRLGPYHS